MKRLSVILLISLLLNFSLFSTDTVQQDLDNAISSIKSIEKDRNLEKVEVVVSKTIDFLTKRVPDDFKLKSNLVGFVTSQIMYGKKYLDMILKGSDADKIHLLKGFHLDTQQMQHQYLTTIIAISWALFNIAVNKGHAFTGGTIKVHDPHHNLFNFLLDYVKLFNQELGKSISLNEIKPEYMTSTCLTYARRSTHFAELTKYKGFEQFGIDIRFIKSLKQDAKIMTQILPLLPAQKAHLLFGYADKDKKFTFIKWENFGLCEGSDSFQHLKQLFKKLSGSTGGVSKREDVPKEVKKGFESVLKKNPQLKKKCGEKKYVNEMYNCLKGESSQDAHDFVKYLIDLYDYIEDRRGHEVILKDEL